MWMGSDLSTSDEWMEVTFDGCTQSGCTLAESGTLSLAGWQLSYLDSKGLEKVFYTFSATAQIAAGESIVISHFDAGKSRLAEQPFGLAPSMTLSNTALLLRMRDTTGAIRDEVGDGKIPFAGTNASGTATRASMQRRHLSEAGTEEQSWKTAESFFGFDQGSPTLGDPGIYEDESPDLGPPPTPMLRITEVLPDTVGTDTNEWIEVGNLSASPLSTEQFSLSVLGSSATYALPSMVLAPREHRSFRKMQTGLTLKNSGGTVVLIYGTTQADTLQYPALPVGVSFGRLRETYQQFCLPTEGYENTGEDIDTQIVLQSGTDTGTDSVTLNPALTINGGTAKSISCQWDFGDGNGSARCNPPSHTYRGVGSFTLSLTTISHCGTTLKRSLNITVKDGGRIVSKASPATTSPVAQKSSVSSCRPSTFSGVKISELLPNPVGDDAGREWIELHNTTDLVASLCGWQLVIGGYSLSLDAKRIPPQGFLVITRNERMRSLTNERGSLVLMAPIASLYSDFIDPSSVSDRTAVHELQYTKAREGMSYAWHNVHEQFLWNEKKTPGDSNEFSDDALASISHEGEILSGSITRVIDPITFDIVLDSPRPWIGTYSQVRVRLPDVRLLKTQHSNWIFSEALKYERALYEGKKVELHLGSVQRDERGYIPSLVYSKGSNIRYDIVHSGFAISESAHDASLVAAQESAIRHARGIWALDEYAGLKSLVVDRHHLLSSTLVAKNDSENISESPDYRGKVIISELYPSPRPHSTESEWIELMNTTSLDQFYRSLSLRIGKRTITLPPFHLPPHGFFVYHVPKKSMLPNSGGIAELLIGDTVLHSVTYDATPHGASQSLLSLKEGLNNDFISSESSSMCVSSIPSKGEYNNCSNGKKGATVQKKSTKNNASPKIKQKSAFKATQPYANRMYASSSGGRIDGLIDSLNKKYSVLIYKPSPNVSQFVYITSFLIFSLLICALPFVYLRAFRRN